MSKLLAISGEIAVTFPVSPGSTVSPIVRADTGTGGVADWYAHNFTMPGAGSPKLSFEHRTEPLTSLYLNRPSAP